MSDVEDGEIESSVTMIRNCCASIEEVMDGICGCQDETDETQSDNSEIYPNTNVDNLDVNAEQSLHLSKNGTFLYKRLNLNKCGSFLHVNKNSTELNINSEINGKRLLRCSPLKANIKQPRIEPLNTSENCSTASEDVIPSKRPLLCKFYATGDCKNGFTCNFMHKEFPCKFFHSENTICRAGDACKFSHESLSDDMKEVLDAFIKDGKIKSVPKVTPRVVEEWDSVTKTEISRILKTFLNMNPHNSIYDILHGSSNKKFNINEEIFIKLLINHIMGPLPEFQEKPKMYGGDLKSRIDSDSRCLNNIKPTPEVTAFVEALSNMVQQNQFRMRKFREDNYLDTTSIFQRFDNDHNFSHQCYHDTNIISQRYEEPVNVNHVIIPNQDIYMNQAPARFIVGKEENCVRNYMEKELNNNYDVAIEDAPRKLREENETFSKTIFPGMENEFVDDRNVPQKGVPKFIESPIITNIKKQRTYDLQLSANLSQFVLENDEKNGKMRDIQYIDTMVNDKGTLEDEKPWRIQRLNHTMTLPYSLLEFHVDDLHLNALADPRLEGHPILTLFMNRYARTKIRQESMSETHDSIQDMNPFIFISKVKDKNSHFD